MAGCRERRATSASTTRMRSTCWRNCWRRHCANPRPGRRCWRRTPSSSRRRRCGAGCRRRWRNATASPPTSSSSPPANSSRARWTPIPVRGRRPASPATTWMSKACTGACTPRSPTRSCGRCRRWRNTPPTWPTTTRRRRGRWPANWPRCSKNTRPGAATGCCAGTTAPIATTRRRSCGARSPAAARIARAASRTTSRASSTATRARPACRRGCSPSPRSTCRRMCCG